MIQYDEIGNWSEIKLDIIKKYAKAYSTILSAQTNPRLCHIYIDAFAGSGINISNMTKDLVLGSPLNALNVIPPFREYNFIDLDKNKINELNRNVGKRKDVNIYEGDSNKILLEEIFPKVKYEDFRRALCIFDPYGMHYNWDVVYKAGEMGTIDIFLNFPIMAMNRNVLIKDQNKVSPEKISRMNKFWGDESWRDIAYVSTPLFDDIKRKVSNEKIVDGYKKRLRNIAGFKYVPSPIPMRNKSNAIIYYLFFASQKPVAKNIVKDIFKKYS